MLITITPTVEGQRVIHDRGLVTGEAIIGANLFRRHARKHARHRGWAFQGL